MEKTIEKNTFCWECTKPSDTISDGVSLTCSLCGEKKHPQDPIDKKRSIVNIILGTMVIAFFLIGMIWTVCQVMVLIFGLF